jgi:hypothetical protein
MVVQICNVDSRMYGRQVYSGVGGSQRNVGMIELLMLAIGIGMGYAAREIVSRRRRLAERNRHHAAAPVAQDGPIQLRRADSRYRLRLTGT